MEGSFSKRETKAKAGVILDRDGTPLTHPEEVVSDFQARNTYIRRWRGWKAWLLLAGASVLLPLLFFAGFVAVGLFIGILIFVVLIRGFFSALFGRGFPPGGSRRGRDKPGRVVIIRTRN